VRSSYKTNKEEKGKGVATKTRQGEKKRIAEDVNSPNPENPRVKKGKHTPPSGESGRRKKGRRKGYPRAAGEKTKKKGNPILSGGREVQVGKKRKKKHAGGRQKKSRRRRRRRKKAECAVITPHSGTP